MDNIDDLLKQQRDLIRQMDQQHQRQIKSLHERISRVESQIQLYNSNENNANNSNPTNNPLLNRETNHQNNESSQRSDNQHLKLPQLNTNHSFGSGF